MWDWTSWCGQPWQGPSGQPEPAFSSIFSISEEDREAPDSAWAAGPAAADGIARAAGEAAGRTGAGRSAVNRGAEPSPPTFVGSEAALPPLVAAGREEAAVVGAFTTGGAGRGAGSAGRA